MYMYKSEAGTPPICVRCMLYIDSLHVYRSGYLKNLCQHLRNVLRYPKFCFDLFGTFWANPRPIPHHIITKHKSHHSKNTVGYYLADPQSQICLEVVEDEVRISLGHGAYVRQVMSHHCVREREGGCGAVG